MAFHLKDGWFFRRNGDGSVTIANIPPPHPSGAEMDAAIDAAQIRLDIDANGWCSVIASMSRAGEENYGFFLAQKFHGGEMKRCQHILGDGFAGAGQPCGLYLDVHTMLDHDHAFCGEKPAHVAAD